MGHNHGTRGRYFRQMVDMKDHYSRRAIEKALVELGAYGKGAGLSTDVLAKQLRPHELGESTED